VNSTISGETVLINGYGNGTGQRASVYNSSDPIYAENLHDMDTSPGGEWDLDQYLEPIVGGIYFPAEKFGLLTPYIGLASTILVATVATAFYVKRVRQRKEKQ
jgi:hypothetical protein